MVGQQILALLIGVRIPIPEPNYTKKITRFELFKIL